MSDESRRALQVMDQGIAMLSALLRPVTADDVERLRVDHVDAVAAAVAASAQAYEQLSAWERARSRDRVFAAAIMEVLDSHASLDAARARLTVLAMDLRGGLDAPDEWKLVRAGDSPFSVPQGERP